MKIFLRAFALALVATGAVATLHASNSASTVAVAGKMSAPPIPLCPPNDPDSCQIQSTGK